MRDKRRRLNFNLEYEMEEAVADGGAEGRRHKRCRVFRLALGRGALGKMADPFAFVDVDAVEPRGVRDLPLKAAVSPSSAPAGARVETEPVPTPTAGDRLARSEQFFKEVAKADGSEVPDFVSDVMAWASSTHGVGVAEAAADAADNEDHSEPPSRSYAEEKAAARAAAFEQAAAARAAELKAAAAHAAVEAAKAAATAKLSKVRHEPPRGTKHIGGVATAGHAQLAKHGTVVAPSATCTPAGNRKRTRVEAVVSSSVKNRPAQAKRATVPPHAESPPSAVKTAPEKKQTVASPRPAKKPKNKRQARLSAECSPVPTEAHACARPTRRGRNAISPLPWWTAAGNAVASKRSLTATSLAYTVSAARVV